MQQPQASSIHCAENSYLKRIHARTMRPIHLQILGHHVHICSKELRERHQDHSLALHIKQHGFNPPL